MEIPEYKENSCVYLQVINVLAIAYTRYKVARKIQCIYIIIIIIIET